MTADPLDELDPVLRQVVSGWRQSHPAEAAVAGAVERLARRPPRGSSQPPPLWLRVTATVAASLLLLLVVRVPAAWADVTAALGQPVASSAPASVRAAWRPVLVVHVVALLLGHVLFLVCWLAWTVNALFGLLGFRRLGVWLRGITPAVVLTGALSWSLGIVLGCWWASAVLERVWAWDPRETYALLTALVAFGWWWGARQWQGDVSEARRATLAAAAFWAIALFYWLSAVRGEASYGWGEPQWVLVAGVVLNAALLVPSWWGGRREAPAGG